MKRTIVHLDLDAFFCAVEEQRDSTLRNRAFAVGGQPGNRGVVASCSYPARVYGVRSAMPMAQAVRLCPGLQIVPTHFDLYRQASDRVMTLLGQFTPLIEQISIDEAFLDVTGRPEAPDVFARRLQALLRDELGLPCSLGVATNKLVAKIANNQGKDAVRGGDYPNAVTVVPPGKEAAFLAPLPVYALWGVGPKTAERLAQAGIQTLGELADCAPVMLERLLGKQGSDLVLRARGIDDRPVVTEHEHKQVSRETTFARDVTDADHLCRVLMQLADEVGFRLRRDGLAGTTVKIKLRWSDFTTLTRQITFEQPIDQDDVIREAALTLLHQHWPRGRAVRLIGVGVSGFTTAERQLGLFDAPEDPRDRRLQSALDDIKSRYGEKVIRRGGPPKRRRTR